MSPTKKQSKLFARFGNEMEQTFPVSCSTKCPIVIREGMACGFMICHDEKKSNNMVQSNQKKPVFFYCYLFHFPRTVSSKCHTMQQIDSKPTPQPRDIQSRFKTCQDAWQMQQINKGSIWNWQSQTSYSMYIYNYITCTLINIYTRIYIHIYVYIYVHI